MMFTPAFLLFLAVFQLPNGMYFDASMKLILIKMYLLDFEERKFISSSWHHHKHREVTAVRTPGRSWSKKRKDYVYEWWEFIALGSIENFWQIINPQHQTLYKDTISCKAWKTQTILSWQSSFNLSQWRSITPNQTRKSSPRAEKCLSVVCIDHRVPLTRP